jgi:hypothetical protein
MGRNREHYTETVSLWDAAQIVRDFPGAVWDYTEGEWSTVDYRTGRQRSVTLHIDSDDFAAVIGLVEGVGSVVGNGNRPAYNGPALSDPTEALEAVLEALEAGDRVTA